ncbi:MAG TPA: protoporphyrinogen oxidase [Acidimicrobiales bacterium]|nr:protoporphyrinogen oxidase [Acidimicrobiales bacterium]
MIDAPPRPRVAVIGGGITGLATAWYLKAAGHAPLDVTIVEADSRLGGKIQTAELGGVAVEAGPDTFLARVPWATDLCRELGLQDDLVSPSSSRAYLWCRGRLRPLPAGLVLGVPTQLRPLLQSGILSTSGAARALLDVALPRGKFGADPSVADVIVRRLGREALELLVEPLVGGINAGRADNLSLRSSARQLSVAVDRHRSLVLGLRREKKAKGAPDGPVFQSISGGMERLVDRLRESLGTTEVRPGTRVSTVLPEASGWRVVCAPGPDVVADAVVITVPAFAAASILRGSSAGAAEELEAIRYASVVTATLGYEPRALPRPLDGSGFLVPRAEGKLLTACTWSTTKWPALGASGLVMLRPSAGRFGDDRAIHLDDNDLVARLHEELVATVGVTAPPVTSLVSRWPKAFPQYEPGHEERVDRIEVDLDTALPGVLVAGAAYRGLGIASCIQQAEHAAGRVTAMLAHRARS